MLTDGCVMIFGRGRIFLSVYYHLTIVKPINQLMDRYGIHVRSYVNGHPHTDSNEARRAHDRSRELAHGYSSPAVQRWARLGVSVRCYERVWCVGRYGGRLDADCSCITLNNSCH